TGDVEAGKVIAERDCKACHGMDGRGVAPGIPHLAAQRERFQLASLYEYKDGRRSHAALKGMVEQMSDADLRNVAAYYASQPPVKSLSGTDLKQSSPYEQGKALAADCFECHGPDGNSKTPGTPSLAGQQPHYLIAAIREYHSGERKGSVMKSMLRSSDTLQIENLALYFSSQTPAKREAPARGDPVAGEPATAMCGGCHGSHGVSTDAATPTLAGQDFEYLVNSIKAYRTTRQNWAMQKYVAALGDREIENIAAFYTVQKSSSASQMPGSIQDLAEKCNRCHDAEDNPAIVMPKLRGQDKDYLIMALRAYRDGKRESSMMHNMSYPYNNAIIEGLASWYASQPAK
ncbi:MAG: c-type cytochrome, partial [Georgfuchsia sp.]